MDRRTFLRAGLVMAGTGALAACSSGSATAPALILPTDQRIPAAEARRRATGAVRAYQLSSTVDTVNLGGPNVTTWTYGGALPGREIRVRAGDTIEATLTNRLPVDTTIHCHNTYHAEAGMATILGYQA